MKNKEQLFRNLYIIWSDFESQLMGISIIKKLFSNQITLEDYKLLLLNHRQQVIEGSKWISLAASSFESKYHDISSIILTHAVVEHKDYKMLEKDYVSVGGDLAEIQHAPKNIGSEALSAWIYYNASKTNPFNLLGAMFIIEGLGKHFANTFAKASIKHLDLDKKNLSFYLYHGEHDEDHLNQLENIIDTGILEIDGVYDSILKTAKVTARLYLLQLEELGNY